MDKITYDKEFLYSEIRAVLYKNRTNKKVLLELGELLVNRVPMDFIVTLVNNENYVYLNNSQVYWLAKTLMKIDEKYNLEIRFSSDIKDFFTQQEINEAENYLINQFPELNEEDVIIIENVEQIKSDVYITVKSNYGGIGNYYRSGVWIYNYSTQRDASIVNTGMGLVYQPTVYRKNIEEITERMLERKFSSNIITLNILQTGEEDFDYDAVNKRLIISRKKGTQLNIIDGFHRTISICNALEIDPSLADEPMYLQILNYDIERAVDHIRQEGKGTPIDFEGKKALVNDNIHNAIHYINTNGTSLLKNKISNTEEEVYDFNTKFVLYNTMSDALDDMYLELKKVKKQSIINNTQRNIVKILNYIIETKKEDFDNIKTSQENERLFTKNNMFIVYIWLAKKLEKESDYREKIDGFLDFIQDNQNLLKINISTKRGDKQFRKALIKNVEEIWNKIF